MNSFRSTLVKTVIIGASVASGGVLATVLTTSANAQSSDSSSVVVAADSSSSDGGTVITVDDQSAVDDTATTTDDQTAPPDGDGDHRPHGPMDPSTGGHVGQNGTKEELLTGDTATKVTAAAQAAVPGGTVQRVENDAEGAVYEAHMLDADGQPVTVKLDASFVVTSVEDGPK